jgi:cytochrome c peroxidase
VSRALVIIGVALLAAARQPAVAQFQWDLPPRVAAPRVPVDNPMTPARIELGRRLFYDTRLSGNGTQSCATCHRQELAFTDGKAHGVGSTGMVHPRSPMSLVNVAYRDVLTWTNQELRTLEQQALVPMFGAEPIELGLSGHEDRIYRTLAADTVYRPLFAEAFPGETTPVTTGNIAAALSAFERSIVSFRSLFDRYREYEDRSAMSESAIRGSVLFFSNRKARCISCHRGLNLDGGAKTVNTAPGEELVFTFHNTGLSSDQVDTFRVPTLRNIAVTAPYMHDGSIATLEETLDHYVAGGRASNPLKSTGLQPLTLSADERRDLIAFLESLTDREALSDPRWSNPWQ